MKGNLTPGKRIAQLELWVRELQKKIGIGGSSSSSGGGGGATVEASEDSSSKYILSKDGNSFLFNGVKTKDLSNKSGFSLYKMPVGNLTNNIDAMTKNGAMTSATIALDDGLDNIIVGGSNQDSYIQFPFILTAAKCSYKLRVRVDAVGGTAPIIGFRNIWPGGTYSNFNNPQYYGYFNLATGVHTTSGTGTTVEENYNGWLGTVAAGDIIEIELKHQYMQSRTFSLTKVSDILTGEMSVRKEIKNWYDDGNWAQITHPAIILADGTYTILDYEITSLDSTEPYFLIDGDSMGSGARTTYEDSITGKLNGKLPHRTACIAAGTKVQKGDLATLWEIVKYKPKFVVLFRYLNSVYGNNANPANGGYATWSADFERYVATIKALGVRPIFVYPETWTFLANASVCADYETYLNTNHPDELKVKVLTSESFYDGTGFHYAGPTNEIIANKIIALLDGEL